MTYRLTRDIMYTLDIGRAVDMKSVKIDSLGRIVIPINQRRQMGIAPHEKLNIEYKDSSIVITKAERVCRLCGKDASKVKKILLCDDCIGIVKKS